MARETDRLAKVFQHGLAGWRRWRAGAPRRQALRRLVERGDARLLCEAGMTCEAAEALLERRRAGRIAALWSHGGRAN